MNLKTDDAVREALPILDDCPFCGKPPMIGAWGGGLTAGHRDATAIECSSDLHDCPANPSVTGYTRQEAVIAWNRRPARLAALAGAEADQWQFRILLDGKPIDGLPWANCSPVEADKFSGPGYNVEVRALYSHAPAKAREVTDADVERALAAYDEKAIKTVHGKVLSPTTAMRAALATFAEGGE